jgi:hypothetical protein
VASNVLRVGTALAAAVVSFLIGFAVLSVQDTQSMATIRSALIISEANEAARVVDVLRSEAEHRSANFYRVRMDPTGRTPTRTLVPVIGDRAAHDRAFPAGEYARFDVSLTTELEAAGDPRGSWLSTLPPRALQDVATTLGRAGVEAQVQSLGWASLFRFMVGYTPTVTAAVVTMSGAWLLGFVRAASRARVTAVSRTLGVRWPSGRDVGMSVLLAAGAFVLVGGFAIAALDGYNGGHRLAAYFGVSGAVWGSLVMAFVCGACVSGSLPRRLRFRSAFSGWLPWGRGAVLMPAVQVLTLTLVVFLVAQAGTAWGSLVVVRDSRPDWQECAGCTTTIFQGFDGPTALEDAVEPFASAVRATEASGGVLLSWAPGAARGDRYTPGDPGSNVIVANPTFIERSRGRVPDPLDGADGPGEWGLLVPSDQAERAAAIAAEWRTSFREPLGEVPNRAAPKRPHVATYTPGAVFNYGQTDLRDRAYSESPVIVVVPASAGLLDDDSYFAAGSAGDLLFTGGAASTHRVLDAAGVPRSVYVVDALADQIDRGVATARARLPIALVGGAAGVLAAVGMLVVRTRASVLANRDRLLFHRTHGRSPIRVHLRTWLRTAGLLAGTAVALGLAMQSGLTGADVVPRTVGVVFGAVVVLVVLTTWVTTARTATTKELLSHGY